MMEKIFLDNQNRATFTCPKCSKSWTKDLSGFKDSNNKRIQLKCKCPCGHAFPVIQERRKGLRRTVTITGAYFHIQREIRGLITIKNISKSGVGLELSTEQNINPGDKLQLKFNLDNSRRSFVDKEGIIKKIKDNFVGLQFVDDNWDAELNDYFPGE